MICITRDSHLPTYINKHRAFEWNVLPNARCRTIYIEAEKNGRHIADDILNAFSWMKICDLLKFIPTGLINNIPALFQIMDWCRPGGKPLFEPMMVSLQTHICVTRLLSVNENRYVIYINHMITFFTRWSIIMSLSAIQLQWRNSERDGVSNHGVSIVYLGANQRRHQSSASLVILFVRGMTDRFP